MEDTKMGDNDKNFVEYVVKAIVDNPDQVQVERKVDEMGVLIELQVAPADMGKIIGKDGQTAKAIRTLLRVLGAQINARINLKIIEPEGGREDRPAPAEAAPAEEKADEGTDTTNMEDLKELSEE
ncbi:MAG: KH domain-containing protein [Patescibacteria group bacterium]|nr:KH domain-containing protein [Patescibacteria group bacterium]